MVWAAPPPKPTSTPAAPVRIRCSAAGVGRAAADDDRHVELVDELLEVERLGPAGDVLGGHRRAADDEQVDAGVDHRLPELLRCAAGTERAGHGDAGVADLRDPLRRSARAGSARRRSPASAGWRRPASSAAISASSGCRVLVAGPEALEVEHAETAEPADGDRRRRRHHRVHRRGEHRELEAVGVDLPGDRDLLGVAGAPARARWRCRRRSRRGGRACRGRSRSRSRARLPAMARSVTQVSGCCSWAPRRSSGCRAGGSP